MYYVYFQLLFPVFSYCYLNLLIKYFMLILFTSLHDILLRVYYFTYFAFTHLVFQSTPSCITTIGDVIIQNNITMHRQYALNLFTGCYLYSILAGL